MLKLIYGLFEFLRYEAEFFQNVVNGRDIVSWAAVDHNRPDGRSDELIGFVTARTVLEKDSEVRISYSLYIYNLRPNLHT